MDLQDYTNVKRVLREMSRQWRVPVRKVEQIVQESIDKTWEMAKSDPERKALLDTYFPDGKPTCHQYIQRLGNAHETNTYIPMLLED